MNTDENPSPLEIEAGVRIGVNPRGEPILIYNGVVTHVGHDDVSAFVNKQQEAAVALTAEIERLRGIEQRAIEWAKADADYRDHDEGEGRTIDLDTGDRLWRARREAAGRLFEAVGQPYYSGTLETGGSSENA